MSWWQQLAIIALAALIIWFLYSSIKNNPTMFSKQNFSKSFATMGFLGLGLIAFIAFCVFILRMT